MDFAQMRKAFVPPVVALVLVVLGSIGVNGQMSVADLVNVVVSGIAAGIGVWFVPNKQK